MCEGTINMIGIFCFECHMTCCTLHIALSEVRYVASALLHFLGRLGRLYFDERSDYPLPPVEELQAFGVVVTTYQRLTNEQPRWAESSLSRIYWLRMVLVSMF